MCIFLSVAKRKTGDKTMGKESFVDSNENNKKYNKERKK